MGMKMVIPFHTMDFDYNTTQSSPCETTPSTPKQFSEFYFSTPTSPTQLSDFYRDFDTFFIMNSNSNSKKGGGSKEKTKYEDDFTFDIRDELQRTSLSAEELFDCGVIRPMKPPLRVKFPAEASPQVSSTHKSHLISKKNISSALSPRQKEKFSPFTTEERERGREKSSTFSSSSLGRRRTRSLSSLTVSDDQYTWEGEQILQHNTNYQSSLKSKPPLSPTIPSSLSSSSSKGYRKWRLKDLFLFRSVSEGRATDKDPLRKYKNVFRKQDSVKNLSFRGIESHGFRSSSIRRVPVSAHELHYTVNRANSEDMKKKTFLPYKQGILGRLAFNPAVHALANGFGFSRK